MVFRFRYGEWELTEQGTPETSLQKLRRLQCEIKDLYDEINEAKVNLLFTFEIKHSKE